MKARVDLDDTATRVVILALLLVCGYHVNQIIGVLGFV